MNRLEQLACWSFGCTRAELYTGDYKGDKGRISKFCNALNQLKEGVPLQYITGEAEFMGLKFYVTPFSFIPRPETEILVEHVLRLVKEERIASPYLLELGTGSGAIAVSLTKYNPCCRILTSDISKEAVKVARVNAKLNGVDKRVKFVVADLFSGISERESFDLIVSNPPYIPREDYEALPIEVKNEPKIALDGGLEGLDFYKEIIPKSAKRLKPNGCLVLEMGFSKAETIRSLIDRTQVYCEIEILKDYNGIDRIISARKRAN